MWGRSPQYGALFLDITEICSTYSFNGNVNKVMLWNHCFIAFETARFDLRTTCHAPGGITTRYWLSETGLELIKSMAGPVVEN